MKRVAGDVLLWLVLSVLLPLNGERISDGAYLNGLVVASAVLAVAVGVRRAAPLASLVLAGGLLVADVWLAGPFAVLSFLVGRSAVRPRPALWTFAAVGVGGAVLAFGRAVASGSDRWVAYYLIAEAVFCGIFPWLAGRYFWQRRQLAVGGWALAEELERGQALVAEQARLRERARIAEDMHDALGHELSLLALRAGALELDPTLGPGQRAAAADLRLGAASATERLRTVIGVLRAEAPPGAGAPLRPADERIGTLVERVRSAGLVVEWCGDADDPGLPPLADRALYRVVQEGLTNATKHAPGAVVTGRVTADADTVTLELTNPLVPGAEVPSAERGSGLVGLAERVRLAGGTFSAEPGPGPDRARTSGGDVFRLVATVPRTATPPAPVVTESAGRLATARRRTRRGLVLTVVVPVLAGFLLVGSVVGGYVVETKASVLTPATAARLHVGQPEDAARALLPPLHVTERPEVPEPPRPPGATCEYYGTSGEVFPSTRDVYRVCFADDELARIDLIRGRTARGGRG